MQGRTCLITGTTSGIGKVIALELARMGATVVMAARDPRRGEAVMAEIKAASGNDSVDLLLADLSSLRQVRRLAREFAGKYQRLHVLVNNAGTIFPPCTTAEDGLETTFAVNHLAPFLLTNLLLELLTTSAAARIVNVASAAHSGTVDFAGLRERKTRGGLYWGWRAYKQSKLANILFTYELARRLDGTGVTANCFHPGLVNTDAGKDSRGLAGLLLSRFRSTVVPLVFKLPRTFLLTPEQGAETALFLASSPAVEGISGRYFVKKAEAKSSRRSYDRSLAQRLWRVDAELTGLEET